MSTWRYYLPERGETAAMAGRIIRAHIAMNRHDEEMAEAAAEQYHDDAGWEDRDFPDVIAIVGPDGRESRWNVVREYSPVFSADEIEGGDA